MIRRTTCAALSTIGLACALSATPACGFAVKHPAITAGLAAGALGFTTCKLASDDYAACGLVAGGAGAFLGLVAAAALWLGGDGNSTGREEVAQPIPQDDQPEDRTVLPPAPVQPTAPPASAPPASAPPASPAPPSPSSTDPPAHP